MDPHVKGAFTLIREELERLATESGMVAAMSDLRSVESRLERSWRDPEPEPEVPEPSDEDD